MNAFKLDNQPKINPGLKVPEGYFDNLTERIMQQLPEQQDVKVVPLYRRATVWLTGVAAMLVIALGLTLYFRADAATAPDDTAIEQYLVYQANISSYDLIQDLDEGDITELEQSIALNNDAIEDYLYNENIINE